MIDVNIDGQEVTVQRIDSLIDGLIDVRFHWEATTERVNRLREGGPAPALCSEAVSYTHLTLPTILRSCRSRWSPYH